MITQIMDGREYLIFRAVHKKDVNGENLPTISYNADKQNALLICETGSLDWWESIESNISYGNIYIIQEKTTTKRQTGSNIFGVTNTYNMITGTRSGLYFENFGSISNFIHINDLDPVTARSIKNNLEVFFIVTPIFNSNLPMTIKSNDANPPKIDTVYAWNIKDKTLVVHLKSILICNKSTKKIVKTLFF